MKKIFVCSRLRGDIKRNTQRAKNFCRKIIMEGNIPLAPHVYFTQFLDELKEEERNMGINAGLEWIKECDEVWVFDKEISAGMQKEIEFAKELNKKIREVSG